MVRKLLVRAGVLLAVAAACTPAGARIWDVSNESGLDAALRGLGAGDEIIFDPGTYDLRLTRAIYTSTPDLTIRGATGNPDDVILWGGGMNNQDGAWEAIQFLGANQTVADLTIEGFFHHAIHFQAGVTDPVVRNIKTLNIGEQHIKGTRYSYNGLIELSDMGQTEVRDNGFPSNVRPDEYVGGIDLHGAIGWTIRDNYIHGIQGDLGDGDAGVFLWNDSQDCLIERNVITDVNKGIAVGNYSKPDVPNYRVTIRNNFVVQEPDNDVGIEMFATIDSKVLNNTVVHAAGPGASNTHRTLQVGWADTGLEVTNNIIRGNVKDTHATGDWSNVTVAAMGNIVGWTAQPNWFVDMLGGDLHLTEAATAAINEGTALADVLEDFDGDIRPSSPDLGADEFTLGNLIGDMNVDYQVDFDDIPAFTLGLNDPDQYVAQYHVPPVERGDTDGNGLFDFDDIVGFVAILNGDPMPLETHSVPEPSSWLLALVACLVCVRRQDPQNGPRLAPAMAGTGTGPLGGRAS